MNTMIRDMITGQMPMADFLRELKENEQLQNELRHLIPEEAAGHAEHPFWQTYAYEAAEQNRFDLLLFLNRVCRFDGSLADDLNIHSTLSRAYRYYEPDIVPTDRYEKAFDLYLDTVPEYYEGPEVRMLLNEIVKEALTLPKKSEQKSKVKELLLRHFHTEDKKRPYWLQGGEWPMGAHSTMKFTGQRKCRDGTEFSFTDVDNGSVRVIKQFR